MQDIKINTNHFFLTIILSFSLLPVLNVFGFGVPPLYFFIPFWMFVLVLILLGKIYTPNILKAIILIFLLIIAEVIISSLAGTVYEFNNIIFPTGVIQYVARLLFIVFLSSVFYYNKIRIDYFILLLLWIFICGMSIGALQWVPWFGREMIMHIYPYDIEHQLAQLERDLHQMRIHGWAQFATANGGLAMLTFVYSFTVFSIMKKHKILSIVLMFLSVLNLVISQARAGMLAFVFSLILLYFLRLYIVEKRVKPFLKYIFGVILIFLVVVFLYFKENPFINQIVYRWDALIKSSGGARVEQIIYGFSLLDSPWLFLFGISRTVQSHTQNTFHIEVEPVNIFVLYGLFGFILQYGLIIILLLYLLRRIKEFRKHKFLTNQNVYLGLLVSSFVSLLSYQVFSVAYFFFREIRVGLIPWILIASTIGIIEYVRKNIKNMS